MNVRMLARLVLSTNTYSSIEEEFLPNSIILAARNSVFERYCNYYHQVFFIYEYH